MLEREPVTAAIASTLGQARAGRGGCLFIVGDAGLGKTACLRQAGEMAAGMRAGSGRADPMEAVLPFAVMSQVLAGLGGPGLLRPPAAGPTPLDARIARFTAVLDWLRGQAGAPVLVAVDDLHWSDADSLALLSFLVRRIAGLPVAVIAAMRGWPAGPQEQAAALAQEGSARLVRLAPLSVGAAGVLLAERSGRPLPAGVAEAAWAACAGNPLLLEQLAAVLDRGEDTSALLELGGRGLGERLMLARFTGLGPAGLAVVRAAAVLGGRFSGGVAGQVAGVDAAEASGALDALTRSGLIGPTAGGDLEFVHPLFRQALYEDISAPARAGLHARAFAVLRAHGLDEQACEHALPGDLAGHPEAISLLESAGRTDLARGALAAATGRLAAAAQLAGSLARPELLMAWGEAALWAGQLPDALAAMDRVLAREDLPAPVRVQAYRMTATAHTATGNHTAAGHAYQAAFGAAVGQPELAAAVLLEHALAVWLSEGPVTALPLAVQARRTARRASPRLRRRADVIWGFTALQAGDPAGLPLVDQAAAPLLADPASDIEDLLAGMGSTLVLYVLCTNMARQPAAARPACAALIAAAERAGAVQTLASIWVVDAYTLYRVGRLPEALTHIGRAAALADLIPMIEPYAAVGHAHILLHLGRAAEAEQWCARVEATASQRGEWNAMLFLHDARGQRLLREGDPTAASDQYRQAEQASQRLGLREPCLVPWARHAIAAHTRAGRLTDANRIIAWLEDCATRLPCAWPRLAAAAGQALLAETTGDRRRSQACYHQALELHDQLDLPLERIETLLDYGAMLRRTGQASPARAILNQAVNIAEATGAAWLAGLARQELVLAGGRRRRQPSPGELTGAELRVAQLAATGKTNTELARQLLVSVNTIETHLRHIYAKLGIHSRHQLATHLTTNNQR